MSNCNFKDMTGQKFGILTVIERNGTGRTGQAVWKCKCECGNEVNYLGQDLRKGKKKACGCRHKTYNTSEYLYTEQEEYGSWTSMIQRCENKNVNEYTYYGGRGIAVCEQWRGNFEQFLKDMGERPSPKHSIDRMDVNGNYEPSNCRWATKTEQMQNRRLFYNNTSGYSGVTQNKRTLKWSAYITVNNKNIGLGNHEIKEKAIEARKEAELKYWNKLPS